MPILSFLKRQGVRSIFFSLVWVHLLLLSTLSSSFAAEPNDINSRAQDAARTSILSSKYFKIYFKVNEFAAQEKWPDQNRGPRVLESLVNQDDPDLQAFGQFFLLIDQAMTSHNRETYTEAIKTYSAKLGLDHLQPSVLEQVLQVMISQLNNYSTYYDYHLD